jgi:hypothetical protein
MMNSSLSLEDSQISSFMRVKQFLASQLPSQLRTHGVYGWKRFEVSLSFLLTNGFDSI